MAGIIGRNFLKRVAVLGIFVAGYFVMVQLPDTMRVSYSALPPIAPVYSNQTVYNSTEEADSAIILLMSYARSGTTFLGELLSSHPDAFYHFEPVHSLTNPFGRHLNGNKLLQNILQCHFPKDYLRWMVKNQNFKNMERNIEFWKFCSKHGGPLVCYNSTVVTNFCSQKKIQVAKVIRLRLQSIVPLLDQFPNLIVVYYLRDPRGTFHSRSHKEVFSWCSKDPVCRFPRVFCELVKEELNSFCQLQKKYPGRFHLLRYEDLVVNPLGRVEELFHWAGFHHTPIQVKEYIKTHTHRFQRPNDGIEKNYQTTRNSNRTAFLWQKTMKSFFVKKINQDCHAMLTALDYSFDRVENLTKFGHNYHLKCDI